MIVSLSWSVPGHSIRCRSVSLWLCASPLVDRGVVPSVCEWSTANVVEREEHAFGERALGRRKREKLQWQNSMARRGAVR